MATIKVKVDALIAQGESNLAIRLVALEGVLPSFTAGAHIDLHLPNGLIRQYSIASAPSEQRYYVLCVKKEMTSRGGSAYIHQSLRVGDILTVSMPRNVFALHEGSHYLLIAGGIGITPLLSMAAALNEAKKTFELHYYVRHKKEAAFVRQLEKGFEYGKVFLYVSQEGYSPRVFLPPELACAQNDHTQLPRQLYVCGSSGFMQYVINAAVEKGWSEQYIHQESFGPAEKDVVEGDTDESSFEVELQSTQQVFVVPQGKTIASVLMEAGIDVPLSCEMGICGACLTEVKQGQPDHKDTVQSDEEKCASVQQIAICCSRSLSPRLTLDL